MSRHLLLAVTLLAALPAAAAEPGASLVGAGDAGPLAILGVGAALACQLYSRRKELAERLPRLRLAEHLHDLHLGERFAFVHPARSSRRR
ncbi:MAG TPA: hypothetical protein VFE30_06210 [Anaeromyxobacteraceae bacterium]|nr:hypothetical protein [Anaeromyxobacteraceae bacterium]